MGEEICNEHSRRIADLKLRDILFKEQQKRLKTFITTTQSLNSNVDAEIRDEHELKNRLYFQIRSREEYTIIGHTNTVYSRLNNAQHNQQSKQQQQQQQHRSKSAWIKIYCRIVYPERMSESFRQHWLQESLLIMRFIRQQQHAQMNDQRLHRLLSIVHNVVDDQYYLFMERFSLSTSLTHIIWNNNNIDDCHESTTITTTNSISLTVSVIKQWLLQLCQTIESLNICGIAHRFIRPENILVNGSGNHQRILVTGFDMACFFHSYETDQPIMQSKRLLPHDMIEDYFLDHLPPECWFDDYDASMVDVWSIGTIICLLITRNNPFSPNFNNDNSSGGYNDDYNHLNIWRSSWERRTMSEEWRTLLDDIFQPSDYRMTLFDLKSDIRLLPNADLTMLKQKKPYYRIDLKRNMNVNENEIKKPGTVLTKIQLSYPEFASATRLIFAQRSHQQIENEQQLFEQKHFRIERDQSFKDEYNALFINDYYLQSRYHHEDNNNNDDNGHNDSVDNLLFDTWNIGLVKILPMNHIPNRHKNILLNESGKIMKYLSEQIMKRRKKLQSSDNCNNQTQSTAENGEEKQQEQSSSISIISKHIHRLIEIFRTTTDQTNYLLLFYESLSPTDVGGGGGGSRSLAYIFSSTDGDRSLWPTMVQIKQLLIQLLEVIDYLSRHAISHRYIRPEFIYVDNSNQNIKLGHFEMSCFIWNPLDRRPTLRHRGLQDEREYLWNHLPPECFNIKYDSYMVDIWSFGTILLYCLVQKNPFFVPHNDQQAEIAWSTFKQQQQTHQHQ
ncbi:hypothetical protein HUG17_2879 [Dermatophagoides farinae]|uniref:Protein kinase domain-containing protein n=1 Tax=Dermatophagoides farinae TaxID=6954 RepID=A0A9D4NTQ3_DERFA|nr:hypothetical protein HUG17_2879 [Dermatophagoides farinae]